MADILIGTDDGIFCLDSGSKDIQQETGPSSIAFLAPTQAGVFALSKVGASTNTWNTPKGTLWFRKDKNDWQLVNEHPVEEEVWSFAADSRVEGRLYLGVSPALLYRSDDGGKSWTACESIRQIPGYEKWTFPPPPHIPHVRFIAPDPQVVGAVYIGVEEGGVYRSADGGETWESLNEGLYWDVHTVVPSPDSTRMYATTGGGFYRSDDGGHHWRQITAGLDRRYVIPCITSPKQPEQLYTAAAAGPPPTWHNGANAALYRSDDSGEHWVRLEEGLPSQFDVMVRSLILDEAGGVYAAAGNELFASFDGGESWQRMAGKLPTVRALAVV
jgi:photosystem II stability/assembly factor-like uncharacterized protein